MKILVEPGTSWSPLKGVLDELWIALEATSILRTDAIRQSFYRCWGLIYSGAFLSLPVPQLQKSLQKSKTGSSGSPEVSVIIVQSFAPWVRSEVVFIVSCPQLYAMQLCHSSMSLHVSYGILFNLDLIFLIILIFTEVQCSTLHLPCSSHSRSLARLCAGFFLHRSSISNLAGMH